MFSSLHEHRRLAFSNNIFFLTLTSSLDDQEQSKQNRTLTMFIFPFAELVLLGIFSCFLCKKEICGISNVILNNVQ